MPVWACARCARTERGCRYIWPNDLDALEDLLRSQAIGTVVLTAGTTGIGAVDPIAEAVTLCRQYGVRIHIDAAYGGFFRLLSKTGILSTEVGRNLDAIKKADSIVLDPHKHGLQPYGCGCILYSDPNMARHYLHDSPYTYFTSGELHLGEISLECSRAGAAAGALWLTLQLLPLSAEEGLGPILSACREAAKRWHISLEDTPLTSWGKPDLDIVCYFPAVKPSSVSRIDQASQSLFERAMAPSPNPVFLSVLRTSSEDLLARVPDLSVDQDSARILRSVLMRPEQAIHAESLVDRLWNLYRLMPVDTSLIIVGRNAVREALERNPASLERVCLQRDARGLNRIRKLASRAGVPVRVLPQDGLRNLAGKVPHQGVLALQAAFKYADYSEMLAAIAPNLDLGTNKASSTAATGWY